MSRFTLAFRNNSFPVVPELSDLVALGILSKPISEFDTNDIGIIINIPYTDESGKIYLNNGCIEFEVVGVNHHKDINDESKPTITLMSKNILRYAAFDSMEPDNPVIDRKIDGNNRWSVSNIRQWLNSEGQANEWFTLQHEYDAVPSDGFVSDSRAAYLDDPGFLAGFSPDIKQHLATVRNKTVLCNVDKSSLGIDFEETDDKIFLPSLIEMGFSGGNNQEGIRLSNKFTDDDSRIKNFQNGYSGYYWTRSMRW